MPQPGDGAYLANNGRPSTRGARGGGRRGRGRRNAQNNFPPRVGGGEVKGEPEWSFEALLANQVNHNSTKKDASRQEMDFPRTLGNQNSPSMDHDTQLHLPHHTNCTSENSRGLEANYTSEKPVEMDGASRASQSGKKSFPPHRNKKNTSGTEKTASTKEAPAAVRNGTPGDVKQLSDRSKTGNAGHGRESIRGGRGGGTGGSGGGGGRCAGNAFAEARKNIPKVDPKKWDTNWNIPKRHSWDSSSINTGRYSNDWGKPDPTATAPAVDWDGKLAPPPPDWDSRPGFRAGQSFSKIMDWLGEIELELCAVTDTRVQLDDVTSADGTTFVFSLSTLLLDQPLEDVHIRQMGEIVPPYWVPIVIGRSAPQIFWTELLISKAPLPDDPIDLENAKPWWERFVKGDQGCFNFLKEPPFPTVIGIDPDQEDAEQKLKRKHDTGSQNFAENRRRYELERQREKKEKQKRIAGKQRKLAAMETATNDTPLNHDRIKPGFKVVVRSAKAEDMDAVKDIYNYYVENSAAALDMERLSKEEMIVRYRAIREAKLPFLVAYRPGDLIKAPRKKQSHKMQPVRDDIQLPDTIVGFAFAEDYHSMNSVYRFTAEIQFYTKNSDYMNGIASCLLDKLIGLLDPTYQERGGYAIAGNDIDGLDHVRIMKNLIINLPFDKPEKMEWVTNWLERWMKFDRVGLLPNIGTKNGNA